MTCIIVAFLAGLCVGLGGVLLVGREPARQVHQHWTNDQGERQCSLFGKPWGCKRITK